MPRTQKEGSIAAKPGGISRRDFLKCGGAAAGLMLGGGWLASATAQRQERAARLKRVMSRRACELYFPVTRAQRGEAWQRCRACEGACAGGLAIADTLDYVRVALC